MNKIKGLLWALLFALLFFSFSSFIWSTFLNVLSSINTDFGYLDNQENWRALEEFSKHKVFFRDYFYEYGWFSLLLQSPIYFLFRHSYLGVITSRFIFLPLLSVILVFVIAKKVLQKKHYIFLFLLLVLFQGSATEISSIRHLVAELGLSFFILFIIKEERRYIVLSGILAGLGLLTSLEYGIAVNLTIFIFFLIGYITFLKIKKTFFLGYLLGEALILLPFTLYLIINGALQNFLQFILGLMNSFYYASPCARDSFPRLSQIKEITASSQLIIFNYPIEFLQKLNFYIVPGFYLTVFIMLVKKFLQSNNLSKMDYVKVLFLTYGSIIYIRTIDTPCIGYFRYGLVPFFLLLTLFIETLLSKIQNSSSTIFKIIGFYLVVIILVWFIITEQTGYFIRLFPKREPVAAATAAIKKLSRIKYLRSTGWYLDETMVKNYTAITDYIQTHSEANSSIYVYPWGPYSNLTNLPSANSVQNSTAKLAGKKFVDRIVFELGERKPKFVVINLFNNLGMAHFGKDRTDLGLGARYFALGVENGPVFSGNGNEIEKYILENYRTVFNNQLAVVMQRRDVPIKVENKYRKLVSIENFKTEQIKTSLMERTNIASKYKIQGQNAIWEIQFARPMEATDIEIKFKVDGDFFTKRLSRYFVKIFVKIVGSEYKTPLADPLAKKDWQKEWVSLQQLENINSLKIELGNNQGLVWWLHPYNFEIESITFYAWKPYLK